MSARNPTKAEHQYLDHLITGKPLDPVWQIPLSIQDTLETEGWITRITSEDIVVTEAGISAFNRPYVVRAEIPNLDSNAVILFWSDGTLTWEYAH